MSHSGLGFFLSIGAFYRGKHWVFTMGKEYKYYEDAYTLYSDIVSGREKDKKNASIFIRSNGSGDEWFVVIWESVS